MKKGKEPRRGWCLPGQTLGGEGFSGDLKFSLFDLNVPLDQRDEWKRDEPTFWRENIFPAASSSLPFGMHIDPDLTWEESPTDFLSVEDKAWLAVRMSKKAVRLIPFSPLLETEGQKSLSFGLEAGWLGRAGDSREVLRFHSFRGKGKPRPGRGFNGTPPSVRQNDSQRMKRRASMVPVDEHRELWGNLALGRKPVGKAVDVMAFAQERLVACQ